MRCASTVASDELWPAQSPNQMRIAMQTRLLTMGAHATATKRRRVLSSAAPRAKNPYAAIWTTNQRRNPVATRRSSRTAWRWPPWAWVSSAVSASMIQGAATSAARVVAPSTITDTVRTEEIDSYASRSGLFARRSTKTGMKVADRTPPSTTS